MSSFVDKLVDAVKRDRVPIGFVMHMASMVLLRHYGLLLELLVIFMIWWEIGKEFHAKGLYLQIGMTALSLFDVYAYNYDLSLIPLPFFQYCAARGVLTTVAMVVAGWPMIDTIITNYLLFGITSVLRLFTGYPIEVMLTISMAIAGSDCFQYFAGKAFGKTKIVPKISPNKSLEGYIVAVIVCNIIGIFWLAPVRDADLVIYINGMLLCGIVGDLFISWWKRNHGMKDTSSVLNAHGGFLDRLDSHLAAWVWSLLFALYFGKTGNFTGMDWDQITILIAVTWVGIWARWLYGWFNGKRV
eukprot:NODE_1068_length_1027_cov_115.368889_g1023_i0.p1 GENE.NODE_1068_length_1027_cov_115.368889_g1023_i0~~NODE_1068_length_1027_cov_115.368889_g1023_i0.p1  ORF type:complete len:300 (-),score=56.81 NODE_1068_length_1027_cov_115.368889_g1023_i0:61-960(-)